MANFRVVGFTPRNTAMESMRMLLSAYGTQLQAKRMEQDEAYRDRMEALNLEMHKANMQLKELQKKDTKQGIENKRILAKTAEKNFVNSLMAGHLEIYQNGLGQLWNVEDMQAIQQEYFATVDKLKDTGVADPQLIELYKTKAPPILATHIKRAEIYNTIKEQSPFKVKTVQKATGYNESQLVAMGMKRFNEVYDEVAGSVKNKADLFKQKEDEVQSQIDGVIESLKVSDVKDRPQEATALKAQMQSLLSQKREYAEQRINFQNEFNSISGKAYTDYKKEMFDTAQKNAMKKDILREEYGFASPEETNESGLMRMQDRNQNKIDMAISRGIFDEADRERLERMNQKGFGQTLFDKLDDDLANVRSSQYINEF